MNINYKFILNIVLIFKLKGKLSIGKDSKLDINLISQNENTICKVSNQDQTITEEISNVRKRVLNFKLIFDDNIKYYEIMCDKIGTFIYNLNYKFLEISKLQYYAINNPIDTSEVSLIFQNDNPSEICVFKYKLTNEKTFMSNCGNLKNTLCFSPCTNVNLKFENKAPEIVDILIQTKNDDIKGDTAGSLIPNFGN